MAEIIQYTKWHTFDNPSMQDIKNYVTENGWVNFVAHWDRWLETGQVTIERLSKDK
jgi:hypothetical protein